MIAAGANGETDGGAEIPDEAARLVRDAEWVTAFSGAGMSAESGIPTFRDAQTGLWERFDAEQLATPEAWQNDPAMVWSWYQWRARMVRNAQPNAGHRALADLAADRAVMVVTQNVDDLHERAGSDVVSHLHGSLFAPRCADCRTPADEELVGIEPDGETTLRVEPPRCGKCGGPIRPGVVWFGEMLPDDAFARAEQAIAGSDVVIVVGTSGVVYPAAALPERAALRGIPVIEFNPEPSALTPLTDFGIRSGAAIGLPALVRAVRGGTD